MSTPITGRISLGKILISASAVFGGVGPYLADWNETHIYNPTWPPHAKFDNAQTMSLGAGLAGATLLQLWRPAQTTAATRAALDGAAVSAALYWVTQISALAYPAPEPSTRPAQRSSRRRSSPCPRWRSWDGDTPWSGAGFVGNGPAGSSAPNQPGRSDALLPGRQDGPATVVLTPRRAATRCRTARSSP
jgi:Family of unknown function (DUF6640)